MDRILNRVFLDNSIGSYLTSLGIIVAVLLFRRLLSKAAALLIARLITSKNRPFDRVKFKELVLAPIDLFLVVLAIIIAFHRLHMPAVLNISLYKASLHGIIEALARGVLIGSFIWLCNRIILYVGYLLQQKAAQTEDRSDDQLVIFFRDFLKVIVWIVGVLLILKFSFGFNLSHVLTGLSIVGAALALAFRESLENLIASFVIFFDKPFTIGDLVKVDSVTGTVEKIGLRSTRIRTTEKTYVTVPNKKMVDSILDNQSLRSQRNVATRLELGLKLDPALLAAFVAEVEQLLDAEPHILDQNVFFAETGGAAHVVQIEYFVCMDISIKDFFALRQKMNLTLLQLLPKYELELAAENMDVTVRQA
jgi:MscS family membrane protein